MVMNVVRPPRSSWRTVVLFSERRKRRSSNSFTRVKNERHYRSRVRQRQCGPSERGKKISYHQVGCAGGGQFLHHSESKFGEPMSFLHGTLWTSLGPPVWSICASWRICAGDSWRTKVRLDRCVLFASVICALWCPRFASAQVRPPEHPLESLMSAEYWTVHEVLQASGKVDADTLVMSVLLHEPAKETMLAWKAGDPITREADVILMRKGVVTEARVDIAERKVESWKEVKGVQAPIFVSELLGIDEVAKNEQGIQAGIANRGR